MILEANIKTFIIRCDIYIASKSVKYKAYRDLQLLLVSTYHRKDLSIDLITKLPVFTH